MAAEEAKSPSILQQRAIAEDDLLRLGEQEHAPLLTLHHIIADGWSIGVSDQRSGNIFTKAFHRRSSSRCCILRFNMQTSRIGQQGWLEGDILETTTLLLEANSFRRVLLRAWTCRPTERDRPSDLSRREAIPGFAQKSH